MPLGPRLTGFLARARAFRAAFRAWWWCCPFWLKVPPKDTAEAVAHALRTPAIMPTAGASRLCELVPADMIAALVHQLEEHRRQQRPGEILATFHCNPHGHCLDGRVRPAEIIARNGAAGGRLQQRA